MTREELKRKVTKIAKHYNSYKEISNEMFEKGVAPWETSKQQKRERHAKAIQKEFNELVDALDCIEDK